jgi:4-amino-4-deoxy-L-arabinose transferase-like glycosyltransferase
MSKRVDVPARVWAALVALVAGGAIGLRVFAYRSALGIPDSDEAVVGLMARHILHGQFTTFYWGQPYGGSQEAVVTAPLLAIFGSGWLALRIEPMLLSAVAAALVWRVGRRTIGKPAAAVAGLLFLIWPPFLLFELGRQLGFYASAIVYCALLLLLALRVVESPSRGRVALLGLVLGLALWDDVQLVPVMLPLVGWTLWRRPQALRHLWAGLAAGVVGALPWLLWNVHHHLNSFHSSIADTTSYLHRLRLFASPLLPMLLAFRAPFSQQALLGTAATDVLYGGLLILFAYGAYRRRHENVALLYTVAIVFPFVYAIAAQTLFSQEPRYLLTLAPVLVLLVAQVATTFPRALVLIAVAGVVSVVTLYRMDVWARTVPPDPPKAPRELGPLVRMLDRAGVDHVYAQYWVAYRIDFDTRERIVAAQSKLVQLTFSGGVPRPSHWAVRWPPYVRQVDSARRVGFVFVAWRGDRNRAQRLHVMAQLAAHGYVRHRYANLIVYLPPR